MPAVFSTCVEVIPRIFFRYHNSRSILHVCGGDPYKGYNVDGNIAVFSTCVEVILICKCQKMTAVSILHVCGGDPVELA